MYRSAFLQEDVRIFLSRHQVDRIERIEVHSQQVGKITFLQLARFVPQAHHLAAATRAAWERLSGRETKKISEVFQVAVIVALG